MTMMTESEFLHRYMMHESERLGWYCCTYFTFTQRLSIVNIARLHEGMKRSYCCRYSSDPWSPLCFGKQTTYTPDFGAMILYSSWPPIVLIKIVYERERPVPYIMCWWASYMVRKFIKNLWIPVTNIHVWFTYLCHLAVVNVDVVVR